MHRQLYAQCTINFQFSAVSPVLIRGEEVVKRDGTKITVFYRAIDPADGVEKSCIPAASIKGAWRNGAETILRSVEAGLACNPFEEKEGPTQSCSKRLEAKRYDSIRNTAKVYSYLCPACRLFGSTAHAGLINISDGWIDQLQSLERTGIAIDRFTGGVKTGALYTVAPLEIGTKLPIMAEISNAEFWHIGLLALICREMNEGRIRLGSGTRNGLGHIKVDWQSVRFRYPAKQYDRRGVGDRGSLASSQAFAGVDDRIAYPQSEGWLMENIDPLPSTSWQDALWKIFEIRETSQLVKLQKVCVEEILAENLKKGWLGFAYPPLEREK